MSFIFALGLIVFSVNPAEAQFSIDSPLDGSVQSGAVSPPSGWICSRNGEITAQIDGGEDFLFIEDLRRGDTATTCGNSGNNGFAMFPWNWSEVGAGRHTIEFFDTGVKFAEQTFQVETFGTPFLLNAARQFNVVDFPDVGADLEVGWDAAIQNFPITGTRVGKEYWPTYGWRSSTPEAQGMDSDKLVALLEEVRNTKLAIDSITIIRNGYLVTDAYIAPFEKDTLHVLNSCTKSITSTLVGIALDKGYLTSVQQPVLAFFPDKNFANVDARKRAITLEHLLTMASGLETKDSFLYQWVGLAQMMESEDWVQHVLDLPMAHVPGSQFEYSNGVSYLLSAILHSATRTTPLAFARQHLFEPLGITEVTWRSSPYRGNIGWGEMMLLPHDMAKIGLLYLNKGRWENNQIVSSAWVETATRKHMSTTLFDGYGYQWWVDSARYYMAMGYLGQYIFVVPEKNMVVVFSASEESEQINMKNLLDRYILPAAATSHPLDPQPRKTERLETLIARLAQAPAEGFMWTSQTEGTAKDGEFVRIAAPTFRFTYPKASIKQSIVFIDQGQVMEMKTPRGNVFSASVSEIPAGTQLAAVGPQVYTSFLRNVLSGSNIQVVSNTPIRLADGTGAFRTDIEWLWRSTFRIRTLLVSAFHSNQWISLVYTVWAPYEAWGAEDLKEGASVVESLTFHLGTPSTAPRSHSPRSRAYYAPECHRNPSTSFMSLIPFTSCQTLEVDEKRRR